MTAMGRLLLIPVPLLALITFFFVMKQWGGIAPRPPVAETASDIEPDLPARTASRQPLVLAPQPVTSQTLPPGISANEYTLPELPADLQPALPNAFPTDDVRSADLLAPLEPPYY